ncbi:Na+/H+ antiporter [Tsukamurella spumae]|uniref:Na+/H+ antiporter n=1 Tax=Tsukamurella spumae TaxID=44753 RepID=A0A846WYB4_9ACTN|nr:Na+/H+ antiporter [Tsukamurella spumae]NKY17089.1 Na+/H+ antiporter [Tsukamurella spumae]
MELAVGLVALVATVLVVSALCDRFGLASPLVLTVVGIGVSFIPQIPDVPLHPDVVLLGLLPPLLYAAASKASLVDFKEHIRPIGMLSVGLVLFTAVTVGAVAAWLLDIPFAAGLALGAIVGPPDAVAATAVGRRIGLPRRVTTLLEGESLFNDATSIVLLRTAIAAIAGTVGFWQVLGSFALSAVGGTFVGVVIALVLRFLLRRVVDPVLTTGITLISPWLAYLPAEHIHGSGVVAVVVAGLIVAYKAPTDQTAIGRMSARINWNTLQFLLENSVFLLIGLQMRTIFEGAAKSSVGWPLIITTCVAVMATVIVARVVWCAPSALLSIRMGEQSERLSAREMVVLSWAGMRGVVTLAAAFILPADCPDREVLVFAAMVVVAGSLLIQGSTLPGLAKLLGVRGPNARTDALQQAVVMRAAISAGLERLDRIAASPQNTVPAPMIERIRELAITRERSFWERLGPEANNTPAAQVREIRLQMIGAEREEVLRLRDTGQGDHEVLEQVLSSLDVEEAMHTVSAVRTERVAVAELLTPPWSHEECDHLRVADAFADPVPLSETCLECVADGDDPVALRLCLTCGHVGCCDSSEGKHATAHHETTNHPVIRSFEPGESWRWCYIDELLK